MRPLSYVNSLCVEVYWGCLSIVIDNYHTFCRVAVTCTSIMNSWADVKSHIGITVTLCDT